MKISVLIVTYQSDAYIGPCLKTVFESDARAEVIVVDNASTDQTLAAIAAFPQVQVIANPTNVGFSRAVNQAAGRATGEMLLLLNPDTLLCVSSIPRLVAALVRNPLAKAAGPISNNSGGLQSARHWFKNPLDTAVVEAREKSALFLIQKYGGRVVPTKLLTGFCMLVRRDEFFAMDGLDDELILGFDDLDLCWRMTLLGYGLVVALDSFVYHQWHKSFEAGERTVVDAMHHKSLEVFSRKLIDHYHGFTQIPLAMELWGIDWFEPLDLDSQLAALAPKIRTVVCVMHRAEPSALREPCRFTIDSFRDAGVADDDILLVEEGGASGERLSFGVDVWVLRPTMVWSDFLHRVQDWFGPCRVVFVEPGIFVHPQLLTGGLVGFGPVSGSSSDERSIVLSLEQSIGKMPAPWLSIDLQELPTSSIEIPLRESWVAQRMPWGRTIASAAGAVLALQTQSDEPKLKEELPAQLMAHLRGVSKPGVMARGQLLNLENQFVRLQDCDGLVWRIDPLEFPGVGLMLTELRKNGLRKLVLIFDNAFFLAAGGDGRSKGISPLDVRREVLQAGFRIDAMEHWRESPSVPFTPNYASTVITAEYLKEEQLLATSSRLMLVAEACSTRLATDKKVSVVLLALNQVEYTRKCIDSLQKYCTQSLELILVNNGSTDGTLAYFRSLPGAIVIHNEKNLGVSAGWNQGMAKATGDYILILNNDTICGPGCIENMVRCAENHPRAGIVAPRSNRIAGPQLVEPYTYQAESEIPMVSKKIQDANELSCWEFPRIKGFCMLVPRKVFQEVGYFDEQFGFGNFEDDDYSCRVRYSGYELLVADDSVLFHFGSVSFKDSGIDWNKQMVENMDKFNRKWAQGRSIALERHVRPPELPTGAPDAQELFTTGLDLVRQGRPKEAFALYCRSLEMDSTQENVAVEIAKLLATEFDVESSSDVLLFLQRKYPGLRAFGTGRENTLVPTLEWHSKVESLLEEAKFADALALLMDILQRQGEGFEVCNLLGIAKYQIGVVDEACRWFEKALKFNPVDPDAILNYYDAALRLGISQNVVRIMEHALSLNPGLVEVRLALQEFKVNQKKGSVDADRIIHARESNIAAENMIREGLPEKAREMLETILLQDPENYRSLNNLGLLAWYERQADVAYELFTRASELNPWYVDAVVNQYDCAFLAGRIEEFKPCLQRAIEMNPGIEELLHIQQEIVDGNTPERLQVYFRQDAEQTKLQDQILSAHRLLEEKKFDSAILLFADLLNDYPENVDCLNGMGIAAFYRNRFEDAQVIFRHALQLSPLDSDTLVNFWDAAVKTGQTFEARAVLQNALSVDPSLVAIAAILEGN